MRGVVSARAAAAFDRTTRIWRERTASIQRERHRADERERGSVVMRTQPSSESLRWPWVVVADSELAAICHP